MPIYFLRKKPDNKNIHLIIIAINNITKNILSYLLANPQETEAPLPETPAEDPNPNTSETPPEELVPITPNEIHFVDTQLGAVYHRNFAYHKTVERNDTSYYRCAQKRTFNCRANIKILASGSIVRNRFNHNHDPKKRKASTALSKKKLVYNGFGFHKHFENKRKTHWRCICNKSTQCTVRLHTDNLGNIQFIRGVHNHEPFT